MWELKRERLGFGRGIWSLIQRWGKGHGSDGVIGGSVRE